MHRRAAGNVEQVALGMVDDGAEGHRRIGRAEGGKPHCGNFLAECFGGNCQAVHVRHLALIGGHAGGGVALDMLDGVHALAHGEAHILGTDIVLEIDEGHDMVIGTRALCRPDQMAAHGGKARGLRGFDCPPADGCGCCSDGFCQRGVHVVGYRMDKTDAHGFLGTDARAGHRQPLGFRIADALQQDGRNLGRDEAKGRFRQGEFHRMGGNRNVGSAGKAEPAAHDGTFQRRDDGFRRRCKTRHHGAESGGKLMDCFRRVVRIAGICHVLDVGTGGKCAVGTAHDNDTHRIALFSVVERTDKFLQQGQRHGIPDLRPVECEMAHTAFVTDEDQRFAHD